MNGPTGISSATDLQTIVSDVLGNLAFLVSDDVDAAAPVNRADALTCTIQYQGPVSGELGCRCTPNFARQLTANLLGLDPADPAAQASAHDAVREFMNVLCGQFVTAVHGHEGVFNLTIPNIVSGVVEPATRPTAECTLSIAGESLRFWFRGAA